jgi:uncharacterized membrane protein YeaQ/YmgE (transglycosylase-associated protein family)
MRVIYALELGALVGWLMKLTSPHPNASSWLLAMLVGALGALPGLFLVRWYAIGESRPVVAYATYALCAGFAVIVYAIASRLWLRQPPGSDRPTIAF